MWYHQLPKWELVFVRSSCLPQTYLLQYTHTSWHSVVCEYKVEVSSHLQHKISAAESGNDRLRGAGSHRAIKISTLVGTN